MHELLDLSVCIWSVSKRLRSVRGVDCRGTSFPRSFPTTGQYLTATKREGRPGTEKPFPRKTATPPTPTLRESPASQPNVRDKTRPRFECPTSSRREALKSLLATASGLDRNWDCEIQTHTQRDSPFTATDPLPSRQDTFRLLDTLNKLVEIHDKIHVVQSNRRLLQNQRQYRNFLRRDEIEANAGLLHSFSLHIQKILDNSRCLIDILRKTYTKNYISVEGQYHSDLTALLPLLSQTLQNLDKHVESLSWYFVVGNSNSTSVISENEQELNDHSQTEVHENRSGIFKLLQVIEKTDEFSCQISSYLETLNSISGALKDLGSAGGERQKW